MKTGQSLRSLRQRALFFKCKVCGHSNERHCPSSNTLVGRGLGPSPVQVAFPPSVSQGVQKKATAGVKSRPRPLPANKQQPIRQGAYVNSAWCQDLHSPRGGHLDTFLHLVLLLWPNNVEPCTLLLVFSRSHLLELGDFIRRLLGQTDDDYFFGSERKQRLSRKSSSSSLTLAQCCG